jgi:hypothetical protein
VNGAKLTAARGSPTSATDEGLEEETAMKRERKATLGRREFLRTLGAGATVAAAAATPLADDARADSENNDEKRKARYQPNSQEVQTFYRVNRYPS